MIDCWFGWVVNQEGYGLVALPTDWIVCSLNVGASESDEGLVFSSPCGKIIKIIDFPKIQWKLSIFLSVSVFYVSFSTFCPRRTETKTTLCSHVWIFDETITNCICFQLGLNCSWGKVSFLQSEKLTIRRRKKTDVWKYWELST